MMDCWNIGMKRGLRHLSPKMLDLVLVWCETETNLSVSNCDMIKFFPACTSVLALLKIKGGKLGE
jgi:hypothetical protein